MSKIAHSCLQLLLSAVLLSCLPGRAQNLDEIGVTLLRAMTTNLDGTGIRVAQAEGEVGTNPPAWEVDPANVGQTASRFSYFSSAGSATVYPNSLGTNSWHAEISPIQWRSGTLRTSASASSRMV